MWRCEGVRATWFDQRSERVARTAQDAVAERTAVPKRGEKRRARDARIALGRDAHNPSLSG